MLLSSLSATLARRVEGVSGPSLCWFSALSVVSTINIHTNRFNSWFPYLLGLAGSPQRNLGRLLSTIF